MDVPMAFFVFLGIYFLILFFKTDKQKFFFLAWISLGIAIMIKQIAVLIIPAFVIFSLYYNKKFNKQFRFRQIFYAALIILLMVFPVLTHNYLLYQDKGLVDMQFSRFFGIGEEQYASIAQTLQPFSLYTLFIDAHNEGNPPGIFIALKFLYQFESLLILFFFIFVIYLVAKSKNRFKWLLFLSFLFPFLFLSGTSLLPNHFVFISLFAALLSAKTIHHFLEQINNEKTRKIILISIFLLIIIGSLVQINKHAGGFFGQNEIGKLINFKDESIEKNSLVVVDSRIYRGRIAFMFWDTNYLETNYFPQLINNLEQFPGETTNIKTYFIEAVTDDSGWGSIKDQPELNQSSEQIVAFFKENSQLLITIQDTKGQPHFNVYETYLPFKQSTRDYIDSTHSFYFYPVGLKPKSKVFDSYETYTLPNTLLDKFAYLVLYLEVVIAILFWVYLFYLFYRDGSV